MKLLVRTPARLHLGLLDMNGELGRLYGSIGVAIDRPNVLLQAEWEPDAAENELQVAGLEVARTTAYAQRFLACYPLAGRVRLHLQAGIAPHIGLGSGTQLALAAGMALATLGGLPLDARQVSQVLGRGIHSGIGIAAFQYGGFVVDGGHALSGGAASQGDRLGPPPVLFRHPIPESWRFVVAVPAARPGLNGDPEQRAFRDLPPAPANLVEKICRRLVLQMLPALLERDIQAFGQALTAIQQFVGDSFAAAQGGRFGNTVSADLIAHWLAQGAAGAGQSSWGPVVYALAENAQAAVRLQQVARAFLGENGGDVFVAGPANAGASMIKS